MFGLGPATKIYIAVESVDMRKGFDGLYGLVRDRLGEDPLSGHLFLFTNRGRSRLKALVWVFRLSWKWKERSAVKITERTREENKKALHRRREGRHFEAAFGGEGADLQAL